MMIINILRHLDRRKIQFDFVAHTDDRCDLFDDIESLGGRIHVMPRFNLFNIFSYTNAWKSFLKANSGGHDILHSHIRSTACLYLPIARKFGYTTIAHSHNTAVDRGIRGTLKYLLQWGLRRQNIDYYFACSKKAGTWLFGKKIAENRLILLKNAIDCKSFTFNQPTRAFKRQQLNLDGKFVIGHVGRFFPQKNHSFLIDVFAEVAARDTHATLLLVGDGDLRPIIEEKVNALGLAERVMFTGVRTDVAEMMQAMDVFLFPSLYEGLPVTLIEAQAAGLPCVTSDTITDEVAITDLVDPLSLHSPVGLWAEKVLSKRYNQRRDMSEAINQAGYDVDQTAAWLENFYLDAVSRRAID
ncbi:MAG: glycosyltransferase family 1 protein [Lentisphaeria bacterium]|nr:glycosyltransferase family 1 protein [Lentisphaeria bacterium]